MHFIPLGPWSREVLRRIAIGIFREVPLPGRHGPGHVLPRELEVELGREDLLAVAEGLVLPAGATRQARRA